MGSDRIALLKAIDRRGSISAAGSEVALSFRAAWDAVQAINALFDDPLILAKAGGAGGGGAVLSPRGRALIERYERLERDVGALVADLETAFEGGGRDPPLDRPAPLLRPPTAPRTSARNALAGVISGMRSDEVSCDLVIAVAPRLALRAQITRGSAQALGLRLGLSVQALIKSNFVELHAESGGRSGGGRGGGGRNPFELLGVVSSRTAGRRSEEVLVTLDAGATLTATSDRGRGDSLALGARVRVVVDPANVIVAVDSA